MIDFERQRRAMVESQLRTNGVTDRRILEAMRTLPRERFVPERLRGLAYIDEGLEVLPAVDGAAARFLLAPMVLARLVQLAAVGAQDDVLDIGCATGYSTAVLARLGQRVVGLEPEPELADAARRLLRELDIANIEIVQGDLVRGHPECGPYDAILLNGSVSQVSKALIAQLKERGRLAAIVRGNANNATPGKAYLFVKVGEEVSGMPRFDAGARPLPGFAAKPCFTF